MLVIGLGRFGRHLSTKLSELGNEVMVIDEQEDIVNTISPYVTSALIGNCRDENVLHSAGVANFDVCFVCISEDFQSSLEITSLLKEQGAQKIVSKADRDLHAKFLRIVGADDVIYPEREMAQRTAVKYSAKKVFDYIEIGDEYAISEIAVPDVWIGKDLRDLDVRSKHNVNIIMLKQNGHNVPLTTADHVFSADEHVLITGSKDDITKLVGK